MKKILCLILTLVLSLAFVSCDMLNKDGGDDNSNTNNNVDVFNNFTAALANSKASSVVVTVATNTELGVLNASYEVYFAANGTATIKYEYERFLEIGEGNPDEITTTVKGTVYRDEDGNYSENVGINISAIEAATALDITSLKNKVNINANGDELNVAVAKDSTASVFGTQFEDDVQLQIVLDGANLSKIVLKSTGGVITYNYGN